MEECGADLNIRDDEGGTPLARAAGMGHLPLVEYFLESGADVVVSGAPSWLQPIYLAEKSGHAEIAALLRRHASSGA